VNSSSLKDWFQRLFPSGNDGRTNSRRQRYLFPELRDRVAPVGLHRLQVRPIHYTAQIDIVAEVGGSDRLASVSLKLLQVWSVHDAIAVDIGR